MQFRGSIYKRGRKVTFSFIYWEGNNRWYFAVSFVGYHQSEADYSRRTNLRNIALIPHTKEEFAIFSRGVTDCFNLKHDQNLTS